MLFLANSYLETLCASHCKQNFLKVIIKECFWLRAQATELFPYHSHFGGCINREMQWDCFYRPLAHYKCTSQDLATWNGQFMHSTHLCIFDFHFQITSSSLHLFPLRKTALVSNLHFCYILQSQVVMIFIHKTETFLYYDGSLKEVGANDLSFWSQRKTSTNCSVLLRMGTAEISRKASFRPTIQYVVPKAFI